MSSIASSTLDRVDNTLPPPVPPADEALLTAAEVAKRYSVHPDTLDDLVTRGRVPKPLEGWKGRERRWLLSEIVAHMRSLRVAQLKEQVS